MILKSMGITVVHTKDGRIQLMQTASSVRIKKCPNTDTSVKRALRFGACLSLLPSQSVQLTYSFLLYQVKALPLIYKPFHFQQRLKKN